MQYLNKIGSFCNGYLYFLSDIVYPQFKNKTPLAPNKKAKEGDRMEERLSEILSPYEGKQDALIPILQKVQEELGYLPAEAMQEIARTTGLPQSRVYAVATFYAQFYFTRRGRHQTKICAGTACHVKGAARIMDTFERELGIACGETSEDYEHSLETVACVGSCALAPVVVVDEEVYGQVDSSKMSKIFNYFKESRKEE
jgi:NADH-quinone oxidoreductase subunit E